MDQPKRTLQSLVEHTYKTHKDDPYVDLIVVGAVIHAVGSIARQRTISYSEWKLGISRFFEDYKEVNRDTLEKFANSFTDGFYTMEIPEEWLFDPVTVPHQNN